MRNLAPFLAAGVFLLHPIQTEAVTYVSSRSELLSTMFYLLAVLIFISWPEAKVGLVCSSTVLLLFALGLAAKETVITLPITLLMYEALFHRRVAWRFYLPFLAAGIYAAWNLWSWLSRSIGSGPGHLTALQYAATESRVIFGYLGKILWPMHLTLDPGIRPSLSIFDPWALSSFAVLVVLMLAAWRLCSPAAAFAVFWFLITLAPTSSFISLLDVSAEHRLYLPMAGLSMLAPLMLLRRQRSECEVCYYSAKGECICP